MRFYVLHFILPFFILLGVVVHLIKLHKRGSRNPLGVRGLGEVTTFHSYFTLSDFLGVGVIFMLLGFNCLLCPDLFLEPENFNPADSIHTPLHIRPE